MHETRCFDALGFVFRVGAGDRRLVAHVDELFAGLATSSPAGHRYSFQSTSRGHRTRCVLAFDGQRMFEAPGCEHLVRSLVQHANRRAVEGCERFAIHAGAVQAGTAGIVLPGAMEAGKTTLVAGLVRGGLACLTDEAVALDHHTLMIQPYPKPLSLDPGSWALFPELEPHAHLATDEYKAHQWLVAPDAIRPGAAGTPCAVELVVFPRYEAGATTELEPIGRAAALVELAAHTFGFDERPRESLELLAEVVRRAECYRLTMGELGPAVAAVASLAGTESVHGVP